MGATQLLLNQMESRGFKGESTSSEEGIYQQPSYDAYPSSSLDVDILSSLDTDLEDVFRSEREYVIIGGSSVSPHAVTDDPQEKPQRTTVSSKQFIIQGLTEPSGLKQDTSEVAGPPAKESEPLTPGLPQFSQLLADSSPEELQHPPLKKQRRRSRSLTSFGTHPVTPTRSILPKTPQEEPQITSSRTSSSSPGSILKQLSEGARSTKSHSVTDVQQIQLPKRDEPDGQIIFPDLNVQTRVNEPTKSVSFDIASRRYYPWELLTISSKDESNVASLEESIQSPVSDEDDQLETESGNLQIDTDVLDIESIPFQLRTSSPQLQGGIAVTPDDGEKPSTSGLGVKRPSDLPLTFDSSQSSTPSDGSPSIYATAEEVVKIFSHEEDQEVIDAAEMSQQSHSVLPLIKKELKTKIQLRRLLSGEDEMSTEFRKPEFKLRLEEVKKRERKKEQNRRAALKSRRKQSVIEEDIIKKHKEEERLHKELTRERQRLQEVRRVFLQQLLDHLDTDCTSDTRHSDREVLEQIQHGAAQSQQKSKE